MAYYIYLFSPKTLEAFAKSDRSTAGVRGKQKGIASQIGHGDKLICYVTKLSRWIGILEVSSNYFINDKPIFTDENDPFTVRFSVKPSVWLSLENGIPIHEDTCWNNLSFTNKLPKTSLSWTPMVRTSLRKLQEQDGIYLESMLVKQQNSPVDYPISEMDKKKLNAN